MVQCRQRRLAVVTVEAAFVLPVAFFLILATVIGSMGIFRYQEVCYLAKEGARYASVRGTQYEQEVSGATAATADSIYNKAILPRVAVCDTANLSYSVSWSKSNSPYTVTSSFEKPVGNTVTVTVTYKWMPELYLIGPITLKASSTMPMSY